MKEIEKRMEAQTIVFGRMVKKYELPMHEINHLNETYEKAKKELKSFNDRLAGRLDSELEVTELFQSTLAYPTIINCMMDYINTLETVGLYIGNKDLEILSCWINDMVEGEYNPPHTHHNNTGYSTVLFLKIPEYLDDTPKTARHKFKDGKLGFVSHDGIHTIWTEPKVGDFFIFEAQHQHCVMPFKTKIKKEIRRSMSFNFLQKSQV
jgi:hypothetical protein|tara:strand:- start:2770 stop:3393 length:624 start_codon:yes stop_codon:yes gene_type:complete